ncbi:MAG: Tim44 domain-containing protein [Sphingomonas sp.]|nr:Tim44 domain-containing protein [Sphingomonas sp.]
MLRAVSRRRSLTVGIVLLAMIALFVGLRLYAVLGQRTGHEQRPVTRPEAAPGVEPAPAKADAPIAASEPSSLAFEQGASGGIRAIIAADASFDVARFLEGAQGAYRMILEAFWKGDREELGYLAAPDVRDAFTAAIAEREAAGHTLDNRLVAIERALIEDARLTGSEAEIEVRFDAFVAAITRNAEGEVVAGSLSDAIPTHDIWTFRRDLKSGDPNWLLVETDEAAD